MRLEQARETDLTGQRQRLVRAFGEDRPGDRDARGGGELILAVLVDDRPRGRKRRDQEVVEPAELVGVMSHEQHGVVESDEQDRAPRQPLGSRDQDLRPDLGLVDNPR
jgi:hypothetical protein